MNYHPTDDNTAIREIYNGTVIVDKGPMLMNISVSNRGEQRQELAREGGLKALEILEEVAAFRSLITQKIDKIKESKGLPPVVCKMIFATRQFGDPSTTPLIAVAGTIADAVADFIWSLGQADKVVINNGGDVAIRLSNGENVKVGIKTDINGKDINYILTIKSENGIGGVATSGVGGRSLTKGIANAAVAAAKDASLADVAATLIGNATRTMTKNVTEVFAREIYQSTDIPNLKVTKRIGGLTRSEVDEAIQNGIGKADYFEKCRLIKGAFLAVKGQIRMTDFLQPLICEVSGVVAE